jgi:phosphatidate cytidylyltransferase
VIWTSDLVRLFAVVGLILIVALVTGQVLRRRFGPTEVITNLNARIMAWWVMVILLALAFAAGKVAVILLFALLSAGALREFMAITPVAGPERTAVLGLFVICLPVQYWLIWAEWYGLFAVFLPVYAYLPVSLAATIGGARNYLQRMAILQVALFACLYGPSHIPAMFLLSFTAFDGNSLWLIAWFVFVVQLSDVAQYIWGKLLGQRKIAPTLSPSKTWEGLIGGVATATLAGVLMQGLTPFGPLWAGVMALIVALTGFLGGIVMSAIKRDRGIKDWGHIIAGHGGVVDRIDSLIFSAPVFFHLTRWFWSLT